MLGSIAVLLLCAAAPSFAGSATWSSSLGTDWNTAGDWSPATVPNGPADVATFGTSSVTGISLSASTEVNAIVFTAGASAYTITAPANQNLIISGAGITNNSGITQTFRVTTDSTENGLILFTNSATAGVNTAFTVSASGGSGGDNGVVFFSGSSNAGTNTTFTVNGSSIAGENPGFIQFDNNASAASGRFVNTGGSAGGTVQSFDILTGIFSSNGANGGSINFRGASTAANGSFTNFGGSVSGSNGGTVTFFDNAIAGQGTFVNNGGTSGNATGGATLFYNNSNAANGTFINNAGTGTFTGTGGATLFYDSSNAGNGVFTSNGGSGASGVGGGTQFYDNSSGGNGTFISNGGTSSSGASAVPSFINGGVGGLTLFSVNSTAAAATLIANGGSGPGSGGVIAFAMNSTGGTSTVKVFDNGLLDIGLHSAPGVSIGSLEGNGNVFLGGNTLSVGSNNLNTTFSGVIQDGGFAANTGGSLTKIGSGALVLSGSNTYTGGTTVNGGALIVNGSIGAGKTIVNSGAAILGNGTIGGDLTNSGFAVPGYIANANLDLVQALASSARSVNGVPTLSAQDLVLKVKGNYTQNASGTLVIAYAGPSAAQHNSLQVQGTAKLDGTLRLVQVNGARLQVGDKVPIITAEGGVSGEFSVVTNSSLLNAKATYASNAVFLEASQGAVFDTLSGLAGISRDDLSVAKALDSAAGDARAARLFAILNSDNLSQLAADVRHINPDQLTSMSSVGSSTSGVHSQNLQLRMQALQSGVTGFSAMGFHVTDNSRDMSVGYAGPEGADGKSGKEIAPPPANNRWGTFITGAGEFNSVGDTSTGRGFNLASGGITLGVDYRFTDHFVAGIFTGYTYTGINIGDGGRIAVDAGKVGLYSTYFDGGFYLDTAIQGGYDSYETNRAGLGGTAHSSPIGGDLNVLFAPGYNWKFGDLTIGPTASFQYSYQSTNGFTESGSVAPLNVFSQHTDSLVSSFGMKASYDWKIGSAIIRPELRLEWEHEYGDVISSINARLASGAGDSFTVASPEIGRDSLHLGAGFSVVFSERVSSYVYYDGEFFRSNYDSSTVTGGIRILF